jgi:hypothetical protein
MRAKTFYVVTRDLHLYFGLFISPFVLVFAVSVFVLVHSWIPDAVKQPIVRTAGNLSIPANLDLLKGRDQIDAVRGVLGQADVHGEVNFIRTVAKDHSLIIPVSVPGREVVVNLNLDAKSAVVTERSGGAWAALVELHKMPGPHNANIRGNWPYMVAWKWLADATVYLVLFISISGIYLWAVLRAERRIGLALIAAGVFSFFGLAYVLVR